MTCIDKNTDFSMLTIRRRKFKVYDTIYDFCDKESEDEKRIKILNDIYEVLLKYL